MEAGVSEARKAAAWEHTFGVATGIVTTLTGFYLAWIGIGLWIEDTGPRYQRLTEVPAWRRFVGNLLPRNLQLGTLVVLGVVTLGLVAIHNASPDPNPADYGSRFPAQCPANRLEGCSRVAEAAAHNPGDLLPLVVATSAAELLSAARQWVDAQPRMVMLEENAHYLHARAVSAAFGFADDFWVGVRCNAQGQAVLEAQGCLRLGRSDLGVNQKRNAALLRALGKLQSEGEFPALECLLKGQGHGVI